jgi:hypothetical protein
MSILLRGSTSPLDDFIASLPLMLSAMMASNSAA